jgi:hypothetical protein
MRPDRHAHISAQKPAAAFNVAPRPPQCLDRHRPLGPVGEACIECSRQPLPKARLHHAFERRRQFIGSKDAHARLLRFVAPLPDLLPNAYEIEMTLKQRHKGGISARIRCATALRNTNKQCRNDWHLLDI